MHRTLKRMMKYDLVTKTGGVNWVNALPAYQEQLNDAPKEVLGWQSPFTMLFGHNKHKVHGLHISSDQILQKAVSATIAVNMRLVTRLEHQLKTPTFAMGQSVLVKFQSKSSRVTGKHVVAKGLVTKACPRLYKYKVSYLVTGRYMEGWMPVRNLAATTLTQAKQSKERTTRKSLYYIPLTRETQLSNLQQSTQLTIAFNPLPNGNCLFSAISHQLMNIGVNFTSRQLRDQAVSYLANTRYLAQQIEISWHDLTL